MKEKKGSSNQTIFVNITIGLQLGITIFIFVWVGYKIDLHYNRSPLFLAVGTVIGMAVGFYHLMKQIGDQNRKNDNLEKRKRIKWN